MRLGPPGGHWRWQFVMQPSILDDPPMYETLLDYNLGKAAEQADRDGFVLEGEPDIERYPLVWVPFDGNDDGGVYMPSEAARVVGVTGPPSWVEHVATWTCRKVLDREGERA